MTPINPLFVKSFVFAHIVPILLMPFIPHQSSKIIVQETQEVATVEEEPPSTKLDIVPAEKEYNLETIDGLKEYSEKRIKEEFGEGQWESFDILVYRESSWVVGNKNKSSGACGLGQALPCSKMGDAYGDPKGELEWTINYVKNRYGTPKEAISFHNMRGWY